MVEEVGAYWSNRLAQSGPMRAVLDIGASDADNLAHHLWEREIIANHGRGAETILELGSGWCRLSSALLPAKITAVDASTSMLDLASASIVKIVGDATELDLDQKFDLVLCFGLLEHLRDEQRLKLMEVIAKHCRDLALVLVNSDDVVSPPVEKRGYYASPARMREIVAMAKSCGLEAVEIAERPNFKVLALRHDEN